MKTNHISFLLLLLVALLGCKHKTYDSMIKSKINTKLDLQENYLCYNPEYNIYTDSVLIPSTKIVKVFDPQACMSCLENLSLWSIFAEDVKQKTEVVIIIATSKQYFETSIKKHLPTWQVNSSIFLDTKRSLLDHDHVPNMAFFQTYLLDKNNKILLIGDPTKNEELKTLYLSKIIE